MDTTRIHQALCDLFEKTRIVFWNDPGGEFAEVARELPLEGVECLELAALGGLEVKILVERTRPQDKFLLYSPTEEPLFDDDWLLDIRLYSKSFRADRASVLLTDLGLTRQALREHIALRSKFFDNKDRVRRLKDHLSPEDTERDLDLKMMAVVTKAPQAEFFEVMRSVLGGYVRDGEVDLDLAPEGWLEIEKYGLDLPFWDLVRTHFGYTDENPSIKALLFRLFVSDFAHYLSASLPAEIQSFELPRNGARNAAVLLGQWRDSSTYAESYNPLSDTVSDYLRIEDLVGRYTVEDLERVGTFADVDARILHLLKKAFAEQGEMIKAEWVRDVASSRLKLYWASSVKVPEGSRVSRARAYEAFRTAADLYELKRSISFDRLTGASELFEAYKTDLYRFDQMYRHFSEHEELASAGGSPLFQELRKEVEGLYTRWFLRELELRWGGAVDRGLLDDWALPRVPNQYQFFKHFVTPQLERGERRRVFVIVSDALRYEAAHELKETLNGQYRFQATLSAQLGVLPSYTELGMAALLPSKRLSFRDNGSVYADDQLTASPELRSRVLAAYDGIAISAKELRDLSQDEGRARIAEHRVVYIYHDTIDSTGDTAKTEGQTFSAVREAIEELARLVRYVVNSLNANHVLVTADHGFVYTGERGGETERSRLGDKPPGTVKAKKRYLLGTQLTANSEAYCGKTAVTAHAEGGMEFWLPKGYSLFHFVGGARFYHGGAMLQEVVVPVITVQQIKDGAKRERTKVGFVGVQVLGTHHKITTQTHRFEIIQTEPVSPRAKPFTGKLALYDQGSAISSIETVRFDSTSESLAARQQAMTLTLRGEAFDKHKGYRLILHEMETGLAVFDVEVRIDRVFADDW